MATDPHRDSTHTILNATTPQQLAACAAVIRAAFHDSPFHRIVFPERLRNPTITEKARIAKLATGLRKELDSGNFTHLMAITSDGVVAGCATFKHNSNGSGAGPPPVQVAQGEQIEMSIKAAPNNPERDEEASEQLHKQFDALINAHVPENYALVQRLTVLPAFERRGIGSGLIKEGLNRVGNKAPVVVSSSQKGQQVYERCGFVKLGENCYSSRDPEAGKVSLICPFMVYYPDKSQS